MLGLSSRFALRCIWGHTYNILVVSTVIYISGGHILILPQLQLRGGLCGHCSEAKTCNIVQAYISSHSRPRFHIEVTNSHGNTQYDSVRMSYCMHDTCMQNMSPAKTSTWFVISQLCIIMFSKIMICKFLRSENEETHTTTVCDFLQHLLGNQTKTCMQQIQMFAICKYKAHDRSELQCMDLDVLLSFREHAKSIVYDVCVCIQLQCLVNTPGPPYIHSIHEQTKPYKPCESNLKGLLVHELVLLL